MSNLPPNASIPIRCQYCGFRLEKEISYLKGHATFACPKCKSLLSSRSEEIVKAIAASSGERSETK